MTSSSAVNYAIKNTGCQEILPELKQNASSVKKLLLFQGIRTLLTKVYRIKLFSGVMNAVRNTGCPESTPIRKQNAADATVSSSFRSSLKLLSLFLFREKYPSQEMGKIKISPQRNFFLRRQVLPLPRPLSRQITQ